MPSVWAYCHLCDLITTEKALSGQCAACGSSAVDIERDEEEDDYADLDLSDASDSDYGDEPEG